MAKGKGGFLGQDGLNAPDPATGVSGSAGNTSVSVAFTAPTDVGGSAVTGYRVQSNDGIGASGSASPITVTGLTNGTNYTFNVWAINPFGWSSPSDASGSVSPAAQIALMFGGYNSSLGPALNNIQQISMSTSGTSTDFGDLISPVYESGTASSSTRAVKLGGTADDNVRDRMEYVTIASQGNSVDFGDIDKQGANAAEYELCSGTLSNETRGLVGPGAAKPGLIDYFTIATTGNSTTFGELYFGYNARASCSSTTRGFIMGGRDGAAVSKTRIDMVVIASTGNYYSSYGDLTVARNKCAGTSSNTRGVIFGGQSSASPGTLYNIIDYFDLASSGNATDFGDLSAATSRQGAFTNGVYAYINGVGSTNLTTGTNVIEYVTIASTGNSTDFGDASVATGGTAATSDSHGGLS